MRMSQFRVVLVQKAEYTELVVSSLCVFLSQHTLQILY